MVVFTTGHSLFDIYLMWKTSFRVCFCSGLVFAVPHPPTTSVSSPVANCTPFGALTGGLVNCGNFGWSSYLVISAR